MNINGGANSMIYFKIEIDIQDLSNLTYQIPQEVILIIKAEPASDEYYGVISDDYYDVIIKNLPRESLNSMEIVNKTDIMKFHPDIDNEHQKREFYGNRKLLY